MISGRDPLFVDRINENFHLSEDSPAIGKVNGFNEPAEDYYGKAYLEPRSLGAIESGTLDKINHLKIKLPSGFKLHQNYPNPFNSETIISYIVRTNDHLPTHVDLAVYDMLGQKIITLVSERQRAGDYKVAFNASGLSSGLYYYRLSALDFVQMNAMVHIK
jgi:hypothetical protein